MDESSRYGTEEMHGIWSVQHKYNLWFDIWYMVARAQNTCCMDDTFVLIARELTTLSRSKRDFAIENMSIGQIQQLERVTHHELDAARQRVESQITSNLLHFGLTSSDIQDNADAIRIYESQQRITGSLNKLLQVMNDFMYQHRALACVGQTHIQPAEITTMGYRFATIVEELLNRSQNIPPVIAKGITGAVGTESMFALLEGIHTAIPKTFEQLMINRCPDIQFGISSSQTSLRFAEYDILQWLAAIAMACSRFALNIRILHSQGEVLESFHEQQVGSSAMPHKKNPIKSENVCGLARLIKVQADSYWHTAATQVLERSLDDSSVRRITLPLVFNLTEELLIKSIDIVEGLFVDHASVQAHVGDNINKLTSSFILSHILLTYPHISRSAAHEAVNAAIQIADTETVDVVIGHALYILDIDTTQERPSLLWSLSAAVAKTERLHAEVVRHLSYKEKNT